MDDIDREIAELENEINLELENGCDVCKQNNGPINKAFLAMTSGKGVGDIKVANQSIEVCESCYRYCLKRGIKDKVGFCKKEDIDRIKKTIMKSHSLADYSKKVRGETPVAKEQSSCGKGDCTIL